MNSLPDLNQEMCALVDRAKRSLVQVRNGHQGSGAGIIWQQDGLVLTNHHVTGRGNHHVILFNGSEFSASVLATQPEADLALLKIDASALPAALISDSHDLRVGQLVFALGHPWGQLNNVTCGVISALGNFQTRSGHTFPYIRGDARLAPGNSGGPLINAAGGVIGINAMLIGGDQGVAIPIHIARAFFEQFQQSQPSSQKQPAESWV